LHADLTPARRRLRILTDRRRAACVYLSVGRAFASRRPRWRGLSPAFASNEGTRRIGRMLGRRCFVGAALLCAALCALAAPARAQYFGRNKIQYRTFDFQVLKTDHFDVYYYSDERAAAEQAARMAERWYARLSRLLDHTLSGRQPLILYGSHPEFEQTNAIEG